MGSRRALLVALLMAAGLVAVVAAGERSDLVYDLVLIAGVGVLAARLRRCRPEGARPWWILTAGLALFASDNVMYSGMSRGLLGGSVVVTVDLILIVAANVLMIAASATFVRRRNGGPDRDGLIDALIVGCAATVMLWQWTVGAVADADAHQVVNAIVPIVLLAVVLAVAVRLAFAAADVPAGWLLATGSAVAFATNVVNLVAGTTVAKPLIHAGWTLSIVLVVGSAMHPGMGRLTVARERLLPDLVLARLAVLGAALLAPPAAMVMHGGESTLPVAGSCVVTLLALWRLGRLLRERQIRSRLDAVLTEVSRLAVTEPFQAVAADLVNRLAEVMRLSGAAARSSDSAGWHVGIGTLHTPDTVPRRELLAVAFGPSDAPTGTLLLHPAAQVQRPAAEAAAAILGAAGRRHHAEEQLRHNATHDALTGLPNRALVNHLVEVGVRRSQREGAAFAVFFIDLDGFKSVNDQLGHDAGDQVLIATAARLRGLLRGSDTVGRLAGDEFVAVIERVGSDGAAAVAQRMVTAVAEPVPVSDGVAGVGASIGIVIVEPAPAGQEPDIETLLRHADAAMYRAKQRGKGTYDVITWQPGHADTTV